MNMRSEMYHYFPNLQNVFVGFDRLAKAMVDASEIGTRALAQKYPPFNVKKSDENKYVIEMAVAGFGKEDIEIQLDNDRLVITGNKVEEAEEESIYRGIASRSFTRSFALTDRVEVRNAELINGMLRIWLEALTPEKLPPKNIPINEPAQKNSAQFLTEKGAE